jgi:hypothetical protein
MADAVYVTYKENKVGMYQTLKSPTGEVGRYVRRKTELIKFAAVTSAPITTGRLKASIEMSQGVAATGDVEMKVTASAPYALYVHEGTRPRHIRANGGALRFAKSGRIIFARSVMHPGSRPNRFLSKHLYLVK